ncbi:MAG TPA: CBS domain-containing protein [Candidatus Nanoarchaeia archaeon]|nr:CBS domain-containing protein [Candidatus Nanoarchaeia archaeon]
MVYFSQLKDCRILDAKNEDIGKLSDLVFVDGKDYGEITHFIYKHEDKTKRKVSWGFVKEFREQNGSAHISIQLNSAIDEITAFFMKKEEVLVGDILDKQVIDVNGVKVVRVNDILLGKVTGKFVIVAVCVGAASFARRLGFTKKMPKKEHVIPWKSVERLEPTLHDIHLKIQKNKINDLHPEDIADLMEDLTHTEQILIFNSLNERKAAKTLLKAEESIQDSMLKSFKLNKIKELLENIPPEQAADILSLMPGQQVEQLLTSMHRSTAQRIKRILTYFPEAVGSIMKTEVVSIPDNYTAQQTILKLRHLPNHLAQTYHMYVIDSSMRLIGFLSARALLISSPKTKIKDIMKENVVFVKGNDPKETAARLMARYDLFVLPVVDKNNVLTGMVKADDILDEYIPERLHREKFLPLKLRDR